MDVARLIVELNIEIEKERALLRNLGHLIPFDELVVYACENDISIDLLVAINRVGGPLTNAGCKAINEYERMDIYIFYMEKLGIEKCVHDDFGGIIPGWQQELTYKILKKISEINKS